MKTKHRTYRFELRPTQQQKVLLDEHFGCEQEEPLRQLLVVNLCKDGAFAPLLKQKGAGFYFYLPRNVEETGIIIVFK